MSDKPVIFSAPMIRALLSGRKSQTRRVLKEQPFPSGYVDGPIAVYRVWADRDYDVEGAFVRFSAPAVGGDATAWNDINIPYFRGQRLWVREAWRTLQKWDDLSPRHLAEGDVDKVVYEAAERIRNPLWAWGKLRSPIHMPRALSRLTLTVTSVHVERLQDITEADAIAEGIECREGCWATWNPDGTMRCGGSADPAEAYRCIWINIHGPGAWALNPWVAAISFTVEQRNIDEAAP